MFIGAGHTQLPDVVRCKNVTYFINSKPVRVAVPQKTMDIDTAESLLEFVERAGYDGIGSVCTERPSAVDIATAPRKFRVVHGRLEATLNAPILSKLLYSSTVTAVGDKPAAAERDAVGIYADAEDGSGKKPKGRGSPAGPSGGDVSGGSRDARGSGGGSHRVVGVILTEAARLRIRRDSARVKFNGVAYNSCGACKVPGHAASTDRATSTRVVDDVPTASRPHARSISTLEIAEQFP